MIQRAVDCNDMTLFDAFEEYILEKEAQNLSKRSIEEYRYTWRIFVRDMQVTEYVLCDDIDITVINRFIRNLKRRGVENPVTINHYLTDIRTFLYWCMNKERCYITNEFSIKLLKEQELPPKHYTDDELKRLLVKPAPSRPYGEWRSWAVVNFILGTGARASTVCGIKMGDLDFNRKEIMCGHTKNRKALILPMSSSLEIALKDYIRIWRRTAKADDYLFIGRYGQQLTAQNLWCGTKRYFKIRDVEKTTLHGLRHSFAIGWVRNNGNMFALQKILGHSELEMTRRYVKLFAEDYKDNFEMYNPLDTLKIPSRAQNSVKRSN